MELTEIETASLVFVDANIFIYHFTGASQQCREFLKLCVQKTIQPVTSTTVLAEVCHRLMMIEAIHLGLIKPTQASFQLKNKPAIIQKLSEYFVQMSNILSWKFRILSVNQEIILKSQIYRRRFGLLTNDSFIPVFLEEAGTTHLATADKDFQNIPHLKVYSPLDI